MRRFLAITSLVLALAAPALAFAQVRPLNHAAYEAATAAAHGDGEIANDLEWKALVAQANADRLQHNERRAPSYAATSSISATDAAQSFGAGNRAVTSRDATRAVTNNQTCAGGTDIAGGPWQPGEYCIPGGR